MWSTFLAMTRINLREKSGMFWMLCFPVVLAALIQGVFGNISENNVIETLPVAVVRDSAWHKAQGAEALVNALAGRSSGSGTDGESDTQRTDGNETKGGSSMPTLLSVTRVDSTAEGERMLADGNVRAMLTADDDGDITMTISDTLAAKVQAADVDGGDATSITLSALNAVIDAYNVRSGIIADAVVKALDADPQLAGDPAFWQSLSDVSTGEATGSDEYARETTLTRFAPEPMARYHFALLGMATMMSVLFTCKALVFTQANLSTSGARITASPLAKARIVLGVFLSGWLMSFLTLTIAFLFIRYALGITVGGREWLAEVGILVASFTASAMGLALGAIPVISLGVKNGIAIGLSTSLAMLAGLMGEFSMQLNDSIQAHAPLVHLLSPVKQTASLFYDLLYYDSLSPFIHTIAILLVMGIIAVASAVTMLRRQRYEHL